MDEENEPSTLPSEFGIGMDAVFSTASYSTRPPVELEFKPWHKPRKQMVREQQWGSEIDWLISNKPATDASFRYLGLPGPDLLDIRYIYDRFCRESGRELTFLGFEMSARASSLLSDTLNVSLDEVRRLEHVNDRSLILGDDFRLLANQNSIALDWASKLGPFDVINIDLTKSAVRDKPAMDGSLYNAIFRLFGIQQRRSHPWSLFLTSRVGRNGFSAEAFGKLLVNVQRNLIDCTPFVESVEAELGMSAVTFRSAAAWSDREFFNVMGVALAKWLLRLACDMRNKFSVQSSFGYRIVPDSEYCDMLSIVGRFQPVNRLSIDGSGLASAISEFPDECSQAARIPSRISHTRDIDQQLDSNPDLWNRYLTSAASLVEQARHSRVDYLKWAESSRSQPDAVPGPE